MEKRTPHCKLAAVKALVEAGKVRTTHAARTGANELGLAFSDMLDVVMALTPTDFYKSMTPPMPIIRYGRTCTAQARRRARVPEADGH